MLLVNKKLMIHIFLSGPVCETIFWPPSVVYILLNVHSWTHGEISYHHLWAMLHTQSIHYKTYRFITILMPHIFSKKALWGHSHNTWIKNHKCTPNTLYIFNCCFNLEDVGSEPGAPRWKSSTLPSELSKCI